MVNPLALIRRAQRSGVWDLPRDDEALVSLRVRLGHGPVERAVSVVLGTAVVYDDGYPPMTPAQATEVLGLVLSDPEASALNIDEARLLVARSRT